MNTAFAMGQQVGVANGFTTFVPLILMLVIFYFLLIRPKQKKAREQQEIFDKYKTLTVPYLPVLAKKQRQMTIEDDYGNIIFDKFLKEVDYFCEKTLRITSNSEVYPEVKNNVVKATLRFIEEHPELSAKELEFKEVTTPIEYEIFCKKLFEKNEWKANMTKTTGDQGVDIFAKKDGISLAAQCKFYSSPVGNKAVQEVFAGQRHTDADIAAVITNNVYTKSAQELATTTGVLLLHHSDIANLFSNLRK